ncbi:hypothetical protein, partial [Paraburkholderia oxyphila]|uniref:hypothetical protein n=1 Tax=Paraburkholderia oxyphila TaxID=614212 RepID=UPI0004885B85
MPLLPQEKTKVNQEMLKSTTVGVKVDGSMRMRMKLAAERIQRTPHWLMKQAIYSFLEKIEGGEMLAELAGQSGRNGVEMAEAVFAPVGTRDKPE